MLDPARKQGDDKAVLDDIRKYVDTRVSPYKRIRGGVHAIAELPHNPTGKLVRDKLPARVAMNKAMAAPKAKL